MKKLYLISMMSALSINAISAANVKKGTKKHYGMNSNCNQYKTEGNSIVTICIDQVQPGSQLARTDLTQIPLAVNSLYKKLSRSTGKNIANTSNIKASVIEKKVQPGWKDILILPPTVPEPEYQPAVINKEELEEYADTQIDDLEL
jgi:hypothetical protein